MCVRLLAPTPASEWDYMMVYPVYPFLPVDDVGAGRGRAVAVVVHMESAQ